MTHAFGAVGFKGGGLILFSLSLDFVYFENRLVLERDGGHQDQSEYDAQRTTRLESQGFRILRFWNHQVLTEPDGVPEASFPLTLALSRQGRGEREE